LSHRQVQTGHRIFSAHIRCKAAHLSKYLSSRGGERQLIKQNLFKSGKLYDHFDHYLAPFRLLPTGNQQSLGFGLLKPLEKTNFSLA
jgi:hypothetical protein